MMIMDDAENKEWWWWWWCHGWHINNPTLTITKHKICLTPQNVFTVAFCEMSVLDGFASALSQKGVK